jgi:hypothetical protein
MLSRLTRSAPLVLFLLIFLFLSSGHSAATAATTPSAPAAVPEDPNLAYFRDLAETRNYTLGRPVSPKLTPDGKHALFLRSGPRDPTLKLYELDLATGRERELLTPAQLLGDTSESLSAEEKKPAASAPANPSRASRPSSSPKTPRASSSPSPANSTSSTAPRFV